jgi:hypothetical protein
MPDVPNDALLNEYFDLEDEKVVSLYLSIMYWGMAAQNPQSKPTQVGTLLETAQKFQYYLRNP